MKMTNEKRTTKKKKIPLNMEIGSGNPRKLPSNMSPSDALAFNQNRLAAERTEFAKIRTDLALTNSRLAMDRTHLSYLRTIVSLIGSGAALYQTLPLLGVNRMFSTSLAGFLLLAAIYFIYKDASTYPKLKRQLMAMDEHATTLAQDAENHLYLLDDSDEGDVSDNEPVSIDEL